MAPLLLFLFWLQFSDAVEDRRNKKYNTFIKTFNKLRDDSICEDAGSLLQRHEICFDKNSPGHEIQSHTARKFLVTATISPGDLQNGGPITPNAQEWVRRRKKSCGCDETSKIIGNRFSGSGTIGNVIAMNYQLNRGLWTRQETVIQDYLRRTNQNKKVRVDIGFQYDDADPHRPWMIMFSYEFLDQRGNLIETIMGAFMNEDHSEVGEIKVYEGTDPKGKPYKVRVYDYENTVYAGRYCRLPVQANFVHYVRSLAENVTLV